MDYKNDIQEPADSSGSVTTKAKVAEVQLPSLKDGRL